MPVKIRILLIVCLILLFSSSIQAFTEDERKKIRESGEEMVRIDKFYQKNKDNWRYLEAQKAKKDKNGGGWGVGLLWCAGIIVVIGVIGAIKNKAKEDEDDWFDKEMKRRGEIFEKQAEEEKKKTIVSNLLQCPDCGKDVSKKAPACPNCGCPVDTTDSEI